MVIWYTFTGAAITGLIVTAITGFDAPVLTIPIPVSYTHLGVFAMKLANNSVVALVCESRLQLIMMPSEHPVSYTHLEAETGFILYPYTG